MVPLGATDGPARPQQTRELPELATAAFPGLDQLNHIMLFIRNDAEDADGKSTNPTPPFRHPFPKTWPRHLRPGRDAVPHGELRGCEKVNKRGVSAVLRCAAVSAA